MRPKIKVLSWIPLCIVYWLFVFMATQPFTTGMAVHIHLANKDFVTNLGVVIFLDFQRGLAQ